MFIVQIVFVVCFNNYPSNRNCSAIQRLQICCEYLISAKSCSCFMCCRLSAPPSFFPHDMKVRSRSSEETAGIIWPRFWRSNKSTKFANSHKGVNIWSESCVKVVPKFYQSCLLYESEVEIFRRDSRYYLMWPRFWRTNSTSSTKFANSHKVVNIWSKSCVKVVQKFYQSCFRYESEVEVFRRCSQYDYWLRIWREQHRNNNQVLCKRENFEYIWVYICQELP